MKARGHPNNCICVRCAKPIPRPKDADAALRKIRARVQEIEVICDEFGFDTAEFLAESPESEESNHG